MPGLLGTADAVHKDVVIAKLCSCVGCKRRSDLDEPVSYAFTYKDPGSHRSKEILLFIPHELGGFEHYTQDQMLEIERVFTRIGAELLPLDPNLVN